MRGGDTPEYKLHGFDVGKIYCWDKSANKVVEVKITDIQLDKVPQDVLFAMPTRRKAVKKNNGCFLFRG
jgi:hypothetical protein